MKPIITLAKPFRTMLTSRFKAFRIDDSGATAIEYGLVGVLVSIGIIGALVSISTTVKDDLYQVVSDALTAAASPD